jgi:hypothetical protein
MIAQGAGAGLRFAVVDKEGWDNASLKMVQEV